MRFGVEGVWKKRRRRDWPDRAVERGDAGAREAEWAGRVLWTLFSAIVCLLVQLPPAYAQPGNLNLTTIQSQWASLLGSSLLFFEAQRSGVLPATNRVKWRTDSALSDGADIGLNLSGGYYDAGDHMKFLFPLANVLTSLAWGALDFAEGYEKAGQMGYVRDTIKWGTDWIIAGHPEPDTLVVQVGSVAIDHARWTTHENLSYPRPSYTVTKEKPGTDVVAQAAAALAAASLVFAGDDLPGASNARYQRYPGYSSILLNHAKQLYSFASNTFPYTRYHTHIPPEALAYASSGVADELLYATLWMYRATNDSGYVTTITRIWTRQNVTSMPNRKNLPVHDWDSKWGGSIVLGALLFQQDEGFQRTAARYLDRLLPPHLFTPGGLWWSKAMSNWQSLGGAGNHAFLALVFAKSLGAKSPVRRRAYERFALSQARYIFGENPRNTTYMVGVAPNSPQRIHHASAAVVAATSPEPNVHVLMGAVINGPSIKDEWTDDREDYVRNEVAVNTVGMLSGVLAAFCEMDEIERGPLFRNDTLEGGNVLSGYDWTAKDVPDPFDEVVELVPEPGPGPGPETVDAGTMSAGAIAGLSIIAVCLSVALVFATALAIRGIQKRREWQMLQDECEDGYEWKPKDDKGDSVPLLGDKVSTDFEPTEVSMKTSGNQRSLGSSDTLADESEEISAVEETGAASDSEAPDPDTVPMLSGTSLGASMDADEEEREEEGFEWNGEWTVTDFTTLLT